MTAVLERPTPAVIDPPLPPLPPDDDWERWWGQEPEPSNDGWLQPILWGLAVGLAVTAIQVIIVYGANG